ncbi:hypothetical protein VNO77_18077 [Canavalia gladiata]|uniref:Uncharacterized protein n=1 Tax=Canavalia gladiata TaxID=3824 RepID=A0AAN9LNR9_CANGL
MNAMDILEFPGHVFIFDVATSSAATCVFKRELRLRYSAGQVPLEQTTLFSNAPGNHVTLYSIYIVTGETKGAKPKEASSGKNWKAQDHLTKVNLNLDTQKQKRLQAVKPPKSVDTESKSNKARRLTSTGLERQPKSDHVEVAAQGPIVGDGVDELKNGTLQY